MTPGISGIPRPRQTGRLSSRTSTKLTALEGVPADRSEPKAAAPFEQPAPAERQALPESTAEPMPEAAPIEKAKPEKVAAEAAPSEKSIEVAEYSDEEGLF